MDCVVLIPGIMGSVLNTPSGDVIWPPTAWEVTTGYKRLDQIMRNDLRATDIVRRVSCVGIYRPLIKQLNDIGFTEGGADKRLDIFAYDWRLDLEDMAAQLSGRMENLVQEGAESLTIVAHSMGGLIARLAVEPSTYRGTSWFPKLQGLITYGTPHLGAPNALVRILGLEGQIGVSGKDFATFAADPRFPSAYQLLPAPGEKAVWDAAHVSLPPVDIYDQAGAQKVGLKHELVARAKWVHDTLAAGEEPAHVRYFFFGGGGHKTTTRLNVLPGHEIPTVTADAGDGTVPVWSAFGKATQKQLATGEHAKFFRYDQCAAVLYRLFGKEYSQQPFSLDNGVLLSVQGLTLGAQEPVELLILSDEPFGAIDGELVIGRSNNPDETPFEAFRDAIPIRYEGPLVTQLRVELPAIEQPGSYEIRLNGSPSTQEPAFFAISAEP
ncbi:lipase family alpha/beta hydrolase [Ruegeria meonggei]|uniref:lipase family alpha/beta hydrolase n=1 Tax=Ruegeria meonggei TaxID=1446476 RepID=UPI003671784A